MQFHFATLVSIIALGAFAHDGEHNDMEAMVVKSNNDTGSAVNSTMSDSVAMSGSSSASMSGSMSASKSASNVGASAIGSSSSSSVFAPCFMIYVFAIASSSLSS